jgi:hypothetical protein
MNDSCLLSFIPKGYVDVTKETSLRPCLGYNKRKSFALSIALCSLIDIDATGAVAPPSATLIIPYNALFDVPNANGTDVILTANDLSLLATHIFVMRFRT